MQHHYNWVGARDLAEGPPAVGNCPSTIPRCLHGFSPALALSRPRLPVDYFNPLIPRRTVTPRYDFYSFFYSHIIPQGLTSRLRMCKNMRPSTVLTSSRSTRSRPLIPRNLSPPPIQVFSSLEYRHLNPSPATMRGTVRRGSRGSAALTQRGNVERMDGPLGMPEHSGATTQ